MSGYVYFASFDGNPPPAQSDNLRARKPSPKSRNGQAKMAVQWLFGEITYNDVLERSRRTRGVSGYSALCAGLREAVSKGMLLPATKAGRQ